MTVAKKEHIAAHNGVTYCIQLTKIDGFYFPRAVILSDPEVVIDGCEVFYLCGRSTFDKNPFQFVKGIVHGYIDAVNDASGGHFVCRGIGFIEDKLEEERKVLADYKAARSSLAPLTDELKTRTALAVDKSKLLQAIIKNHYMSERYAGRAAT